MVISLYFHIPFCTRKCDYCHFYVLPDREADKDRLMEGFLLEWQQIQPLLKHQELASVYFGGGTPFLLGPKRIETLLSWVKTAFPSSIHSAEITLEANPENITQSLMAQYAAAGINRVSIGIQTLDDGLLEVLTRQHSAKKAKDAVHATALAGIKNISIDLMYDLPGQTLQQWENTLKQAVELPITHLSLYNLTLEPHTVFFKKRELLQKSLPDEEASLAMYQMAVSLLEQGGLHQYEISAFCKDHLQSRHNVGYWTSRAFLGLGPSAYSYWEGRRFRNIANLSRYCQALKEHSSPIDFEEELEEEAKVRELFTIQLRLLSGINFAKFQAKHGPLPQEFSLLLKKLAQEGLLHLDPSHVSLTQRGVLFYDSIAVELI